LRLYHRRITCLLNKQLHHRNVNRETLKLTEVSASDKLENFRASQEVLDLLLLLLIHVGFAS
ncbi:hypothetical protein GIB67_001245, partial [Kingdonia uniflora]